MSRSILTESYASCKNVTQICKKGSIWKNTLRKESQLFKLCYRSIEVFTSDAYLLAAGLAPSRVSFTLVPSELRGLIIMDGRSRRA